MVLKLSFLLVFFYLLSSCNSSNQEIDPNSSPKEKGKFLFMKHCASCHGIDGQLGASGAKDLSTTNLSNRAVFLIISNGKNAMPPMKNMFKDSSEISLIISHIKTLKKP